MDILKERYSLVQERITEICQETDFFQSEKDRFWHVCAELVLGKENEEIRFLDYTFCDSAFGEVGRYWCFLFAQMMQVPGFYRKKQTELVCVCCELFAELYRITTDGEDVKAVRNTLYWFYSDYCELYSRYWIEELTCHHAAILGGPMLLMDFSQSNDPMWMQHIGDFGLYMGSRFEERCYQAVMLVARSGLKDACRKFAEILSDAEKLDLSIGFKAAKRQQEGMLHLAGRIISALSD